MNFGCKEWSQNICYTIWCRVNSTSLCDRGILGKGAANGTPCDKGSVIEKFVFKYIGFRLV